ncbi:ribonuclease H-like domain-containing protein [Tanacetum coccineum]
MSRHKGIYVIPSHTKKVFANMKIPGKGFSGKVTPLFETMMVQATKDMGEDSIAPTNSYSTPIHTQPSSSKPQKKKSRRKQRKDSGPIEPIPDDDINEEHVATPSCDPPQSVRKSKNTGFKEMKEKVGSASRVESSNDVSLGAQKDASKQGRKIVNKEGQYRAAGPGFYQQNNGNSLYPDRRPNLEESLTKFIAESAKRHEENSNIIKETQASTDVAIRNQGVSIKSLEIQIGQMSKVLQERVCGPYAVSGKQNRSIFFDTIPFLRRLQNFGCDDWREAQDVKILETYDHTLPQKEKDPGSFTLPCFIHNICFDKALVDLGVSVSIMLFSTYTNLGLGILSHTMLTIKLADRTIKQPRGIAKNVLVRIGKFIFPIDFIILDIPEDDDVPLILGRPFLSTAHSKIDVFKRKITLRVGEEKLVFKSFIIIDGDDITKDVVLGMKYCKYASCQMIMRKFAHGDGCERIEDE